MKSLQPCPTLCNPMNHSWRVSSVYRILQARRLRWVAMLPSRGSSWHRDRSPVSYICLHWQAGSLLLAPPEKPSVSLAQSISHVWLFATLWIAACQASLSITNSQSSLRLTSIDSVMPSSRLILCHPLLLLPPIPPRIRVFSISQLFTSGDKGIGVSALASVLPKKSQGWSLLKWTGWISLQSKGLSRVFSNTTVQKHQFFGT